jgi:hypothetical protein
MRVYLTQVLLTIIDRLFNTFYIFFILISQANILFASVYREKDINQSFMKTAMIRKSSVT